MNSLAALTALNFFMADVHGGLGPFLGVFLQAQHWLPAQIGIVMTIGGIAGMVVTTPAGALVDHTHHKRAIVVTTVIIVTAGSLAILIRPDFAVVSGAQIISGIAAAAIGPALAAITLGLVRQSGFAHQLGRNEAFNHGGNVAAVALAGGIGAAVALWLLARPLMGPACAGPPDNAEAKLAA
jgi:MFS family permease